METKKLDSMRMRCYYVSPEIKEIIIDSSQHILQGSELNLDPENGIW